MIDQPQVSTGIDVVGDLAWGSHICLFYQTLEDLVEVNAAYFQAGLENGEFCIWALSDPIAREDAVERLRCAIPKFDVYLQSGQIELIEGYKWYLRGSTFDPRSVTSAWHAKLDLALAKGFTGMRISGNAFWMECNLWREFEDYEIALEAALNGRKMIALCTYSLDAGSSADVLDVARSHNFSIARREGHWQFLEKAELAEVRRHARQLDSPADCQSGLSSGWDLLTPRERVVLAQIIKGASSKESGRILGISPRTIEFHRNSIMRKFGARNTADLLGRILAAAQGQKVS
jgi:DNA-binding CsgD family transcriptional regulator